MPGPVERLSVEGQERVVWQREGLVRLNGQTVASRLIASRAPVRTPEVATQARLVTPSDRLRRANPLVAYGMGRYQWLKGFS